MNAILGICRKVKDITDEDLAAAEDMAKDQINYFSPLNNATTKRQHELGQHNAAVVKKLRELRDVIHAGSSIAK